MKIVTRFAPSNTGKLHVGSARTALFALALAKSCDGICSLRIEDTDAKRSKSEFTDEIIDSLRWLGLEFSNSKPLFQSENKKEHIRYAESLGRELKAYEKDGAIYFRVPNEAVCFHDGIFGSMTANAGTIKDFVIVRSDGSPTFHLSSFIDDALQGVNCIIRGRDHLDNTFKHILLFKAVNLNVPTYFHLPLITDANGEKLSKRRSDQCVYIRDFREQGYMPQAILDYISQLGWNRPCIKEPYSLANIIKYFDLRKISTNDPQFCIRSLDAVNEQWMRSCSRQEYEQNLKQFLEHTNLDQNKVETILNACTHRIKKFGDIHKFRFLVDEPELCQESIGQLKTAKKSLAKMIEVLSDVSEWDQDEVKDKINVAIQETKTNRSNALSSLQLAVTGTRQSPPVHAVIHTIGKDRAINRIKQVVGQ